MRDETREKARIDHFSNIFWHTSRDAFDVVPNKGLTSA